MFNYFNFKRTGNKILLTNDQGKYIFLTVSDFNKMIGNPKQLSPSILEELQNKYFIVPDTMESFSEDLLDATISSKIHLFSATTLFIIVIDERCNCDCIYCQASSQISGIRQKKAISNDTLISVLNFILESPSNDVTIEFQGGEPLLSFDKIKFAIEYINKNKGFKRVSFSLVSNLILMTNEIASFLRNHHVNISTSLDGNRLVHESNRHCNIENLTSYDLFRNGLNIARSNGLTVGAIETTTRYSLPHAQDILNGYIENGFNEIFIRPLTRLGAANTNWNTIGYTPAEFLSFYKECLELIIKTNQSGTPFKEVTATLFLSKILQENNTSYMDLGSPCGACIGQMALDVNGNVFSCDEGRMLYYMGDEKFLLGNTSIEKYSDIIDSIKCNQICSAGIMESSTECSTCVYLPYCGICPVMNYVETGSMNKRKLKNFRCQIYKGILDILFNYLSNGTEAEKKILKEWI